VSVTSPPGARTAVRHRVTRSPRRRRLAPIAIVGVVVAALVAAAIPLERVRVAAANGLFHLVERLIGGVPTAMAVAGWLAYGLLPLVVIVLDRDHRRRFGRPEFGIMSDSTQLIERIRASNGHRVAGRSVRHWLSRSPLLIVLAFAVLFLPIPGRHHPSLADTMGMTHGGAAFLIGTQWACIAGVLGVMIVILAPVLAARRPPASPRSPLRAYAAAMALPVVALAVAIMSA
jgi:hypothetical protein